MSPRQANHSYFFVEPLYNKNHLAHRVLLQQEVVADAQSNVEQARRNLASVAKLLETAAKIQLEADLTGDAASKADSSFLSRQVNSLAKATADTAAKAEANLQRAAAILSYFNELASMAHFALLQ